MAIINVTHDQSSYTGTSADDIFNNVERVSHNLGRVLNVDETPVQIDGGAGIDTLNFDAALFDGGKADDVASLVTLEGNQTIQNVSIANAEILTFTNGTIDLTSAEAQYLTVSRAPQVTDQDQFHKETPNVFAADTVLAYLPGADDNVTTLEGLTVQSVNGQDIDDGQAISLENKGSLAYNGPTLTFTAFTDYAASLGYGETEDIALDVTFLDDEDEITVTYTATIEGTFSEGDDVYRASNTEENDHTLLDGRGGNDTISGDQGADTIYGGAGDDSIFAGSKDGEPAMQNATVGIQATDIGDTFAGGAGNDAIYGGPGNDILVGDDYREITGTDFDASRDGADTIYGGTGDDTIHTGSRDEKTHTGTADDVAYGGDGTDRIWGAGGGDTLGGGNDNDWIHGGAGDDVVFGGDDDGADMVYGESGDDTIYGGNGNDTLDGDADDDLIFNGGGNDTVHGGSGNDTIWGGAGDDTLTGDQEKSESNDSDVFAFVAGNGTDTITDFETGIDQVDLSALGLDADDLDGMMGQVGTDTALFYGDGDIIIFGGASTAVDADDFIL